MRDYKEELERRVEFIKEVLESSGANGIVYGNSGGKDCALVGILCKKACTNTVGVILPCGTSRNFAEDKEDALKIAKQFSIETREVDLTKVREAELNAVNGVVELKDSAVINIAPRLRMTTLYLIAGSENRLVAGTGNRSEAYVGYFTKWGDGAHDFNPIADLTVTEVYEFLRYLGAPASIIEKAPSAGLREGQTDEGDMGVTYATLDRYILTGEGEDKNIEIIEKLHKSSRHKRQPIRKY